MNGVLLRGWGLGERSRGERVGERWVGERWETLLVSIYLYKLWVCGWDS